MLQTRLLTLLSDFGLSDVYVGVMKGAIAQINPTLTVIDLTHQIPPQNLAAARFNLMSAYPYFPNGTVHVAVVDPGVGSQRRAIALELTDGYLVGPDNGIFSGILDQRPVIAAVELTHSQYWRVCDPSATFHGRDIFASVGAYLAMGTPLQALGISIDPTTLTQLLLPACTQNDSEMTGCVQHVDHFGNLITNIPGSVVQGKSWSVRVNELIISGHQIYTDLFTGNLLALVGSHGWIEIAANGSNAQAQLNLTWKSPIQVLVNT